MGWVPALEDRPRIERAVDEGGARPVIDQLPQKLDTMLGGWFEEGQELSGGQWQKIALARAFMRDSEVLVLDEPTAALDAEAEHELFGRLQQLAATRTAILISHRFSTVRRADRIAVLQRGPRGGAGHARRAAGRATAATRTSSGCRPPGTSPDPVRPVSSGLQLPVREVVLHLQHACAFVLHRGLVMLPRLFRSAQRHPEMRGGEPARFQIRV